MSKFNPGDIVRKADYAADNPMGYHQVAWVQRHQNVPDILVTKWMYNGTGTSAWADSGVPATPEEWSSALANHSRPELAVAP